MMWTSRPGQLSGKGEKLEDLTVCFAARGEREQNKICCNLELGNKVCAKKLHKGSLQKSETFVTPVFDPLCDKKIKPIITVSRINF